MSAPKQGRKKKSGKNLNDRHTSCIFLKTEDGDNWVIGKLMEKRQGESFRDRNKGGGRGEVMQDCVLQVEAAGGRGNGEIDGRRRRRYEEMGVKGAGGGLGGGVGGGGRMGSGGRLLPAADGSQSQ